MSDEKEAKVVGRFEMLWDCQFCGKTKLLGITHRHCPECGAVQDQTKRYFPSDAEKVAVKDDYAGGDRVCASCKHPNGAKATFCAGCGSPLDEAASAKVRSERVAKLGQGFAADDAKAAEAELAPGAKAKPIAKKKSWVWLYILLFGLALILAIYMLCIRKKAGNFEVTAQLWERRIEIEEYKEKSGDSWRDQVPAGASVRNCHDKEYSRAVPEDCQTRQVDKGDGTMEERQECTPAKAAVEKEWCSYTVRKWEVDDELAIKNSGEGTSIGDWPVSSYPSNVEQRIGARREKGQKQILTIKLKGTGGSHSCTADEIPGGEEAWRKLTPGTKAKGSVRGAGDAIVCGDLHAE